MKKLKKDPVLDKWFKEQRLLMTGNCMHCGSPTTKYDNFFYKFSIAHIFPKAYFKSIRTHPKNALELCFWGNSCHTNYDNGILTIEKMNCYDTIKERIIALFPHIDPCEHWRIPDNFMQIINNNL